MERQTERPNALPIWRFSLLFLLFQLEEREEKNNREVEAL